MIAPVRARLRTWYFRTLRRSFETDDGREIAVDALQGLLASRPDLPFVAGDRPYADLGSSPASGKDYSGTTFITAGFRTGSTLVWNICRHMPGCVAYYEPLNERRLFDPAARGERVDPTHRGVLEYWREYEGLLELGRWHRSDWTTRSLVMAALDWEPDLRAYFDCLIARGAPRRVVIQENRIDFRLPWIRRQFPGATIVHLYRHPRDQWCSSLMKPAAVPRDIAMADFEPYDHFYLKAWARDLQRHFPFLAERQEQRPYRAFYLIWKLSYLFGVAWSDHSLAYEDLVRSPALAISRLGAAMGIAVDADRLAALVSEGAIGRWREYADAKWFESHESTCEDVLADFFRGVPSERRSLMRAAPEPIAHSR